MSPSREDSFRTAAGRLGSWKEIATHLKVSVRTAQRWEKTEHLPVHRHKHAALSSVFAYAEELGAWWTSHPEPRQTVERRAPGVPSVAVLPFGNLNGDSETEILSDGLTEELIHALTRVEGLHVVARTSAFHFKGKTGDARAVGARLGVRTIIEGSVRRAGERLRVTARLIAVNDGCHVWSDRFDRKMTDLFDLQEEIARAIVDSLGVKVTAARVTGHYGHDIEAYRFYLEGRHYWNTRTVRGIFTAVDCFERALARDGQMAPAWAGLAGCYAMLPVYGALPAVEAVQQAKSAVLKALEIDRDLADAHTMLGFIAGFYDYDWVVAESHFRHALALSATWADSHLFYVATVLGPTGRLREAAVHLARASELDPFSAVLASACGANWLMSGRVDLAISSCRRALELDPVYPWAYRWLGEAYLLQSMFKEAEDAFRRIESSAFAAGFLGYCSARTGRKADALDLLRELEASSNPFLSYQIAVVHLGLDDFDGALQWLHRACEARSLGVHWVKTDPIWKPLKPDGRFQAVLERMGLSD